MKLSTVINNSGYSVVVLVCIVEWGLLSTGYNPVTVDNWHRNYVKHLFVGCYVDISRLIINRL